MPIQFRGGIAVLLCAALILGTLPPQVFGGSLPLQPVHSEVQASFDSAALIPLTFISGIMNRVISGRIVHAVSGLWPKRQPRRDRPFITASASAIVIALIAAQSLFSGFVHPARGQDNPIGKAVAGVAKAFATKLPWSETMNTIPVPDLMLMIDWMPEGGVRSIFNEVYDWYRVHREDIPSYQFDLKVSAMTHAELRALLSDYFSSASVESWKRLYYPIVLAERQRMIDDPEFLAVVKEFSTGLFGRDIPALPYWEIFQIWRSEPRDRQAYTAAMRTAEFSAFTNFLKQNYQIRPYENLHAVVTAYLQPARNRQYHDPLFIEAFQLFQQYFPEGPYDRFGYLDVVLSVPMSDAPNANENWELFRNTFRTSQGRQRYEAALKRFHQDLIALQAIYHLPIHGPLDYRQLFQSLKLEREELLTLSGGVEVYQYYRHHYPERLAAYGQLADLFLPAGFHEQLVKPLMDLWVPIAVLDDLLKSVGTNLGSMRILTRPGDREILQTALQRNLAQDPSFQAFREDFFIRYPSLNRDAFSSLVSLMNAYGNPDFLRWNAAREQWGPFRLPDFKLTDADVKIRVLNAAANLRLKRPGLVFSELPLRREAESNVFDTFSNRAQLSNLAYCLERADAETLYLALLDRWGLRQIHLKDFASVIARSEEREFFMDTENARRFRDLTERHHLRGYDNVRELTLQDLSHNAKAALRLYPLLTSPESSNRVVQYLGWVVSADDTTDMRLWRLPQLDKFNVNLVNDPLFFRFATALRRLGLKDSDIGGVLGLEKNDTPLNLTDIERLENDQTPIRLAALRAFYQEHYSELYRRNPNAAFRLYLRYELFGSNFDAIFGIFPTLKAIGLDLDDDTTLTTLLRELQLNPDLYAHLTDPRFIQFYTAVRERYYGNTVDVKAIADFAELFDQANENPGKAEIVLSTRLEPLLHFMRTHFGLTHLDPATLVPLTQAALDFDPDATDVWIKRLEARGDAVNANDVILLTEIQKHPEMAKVAADRAALERSVQDLVYGRPVLPRQISDHESYWDLQRAIAFQRNQEDEIVRMDSEIRTFHVQYTERPSIAAMSTLQLLRLKLLVEALQNSNTLQDLGRIVGQDLVDQGTEYGGVVTVEGGRVNFKKGVSYSDNNTKFVSGKYAYFPGGLMTFHLHAIATDARGYSGPSGWKGGTGGDIAYVTLFGVTDAVITPLGYVRTAEGVEDRSRIRVNIDVYDRDHIVDIGEYILPVSETPKPPRSPFLLGARNIPALFLAVLLGSAFWAQADPLTEGLSAGGSVLFSIGAAFLAVSTVAWVLRAAVRLLKPQLRLLPGHAEAVFRAA